MVEQEDKNQSYVNIENIHNSTLVIGAIAGRDVIQLPPAPRICPTPTDRFVPFGGRDDELSQILEALSQGQDCAITAVTGGGGIGKTTLATVIAQQSYKQKLFRSVLWVEVNQHPDLLQILLEWGLKADGQFEIKNRSIPALIEVVRALLTDLIGKECETCEGNRVLVVLDNVWSDGYTVVQALRNTAPQNSTFLLTARSQEVAIDQNINTSWSLGYLLGDKAVDFLVAYLPAPPRNTLLPLANALGGYPLAMELAAVRVKRMATRSGMEILQALAQATQEYETGILADKSFAGLHLEIGDTKERNLTLSLSYSYHELPSDDQRRFRQLGVLPMELKFDKGLLRHIWQEDNLEKVLEYCDTLCLVALMSNGEAEGWYSQHRLLRAYAYALLKATDGEEVVARRTIEGLLNRGTWLHNKGYNAHALPYQESALVLAQKWQDQKGQATSLNNIGGTWSALGEKQKALIYLEQALPRLRAIGDQSGEAATLNNIGVVLSALGEQRKALTHYEQSLSLREIVNDRSGEANTLSNIGMTLDALGEKNKALTYYKQALLIQQAIGNRDGEATTLNNMGGVWNNLGEKRQALAYYEQALPLYQALGNRGGLAASLNNIGGVWSSLGEHRKALIYYEQALPLLQTIGDRSHEAINIHNIGDVWASLGEAHKALTYYEQALVLLREVGNRDGEATTLNGIGKVWSDLGEQHKALIYYEQALPLKQAVEDRRGEATTLNNIGTGWFLLGEAQKALLYFEQALPLQIAIGDKTGEATSYYNIGIIKEANGDIKGAVVLLTNAVSIMEAMGHHYLGSMQKVLEHFRRKQIGMVEPPTLPTKTLEVLMSNTVFVCTEAPDKLNEWQKSLSTARAQFVAQGAQTKTIVAFVDALLAILSGKTPTLPDDSPYSSIIAQINTAIATYHNKS